MTALSLRGVVLLHIAVVAASAQIFGTVRGTVSDPQSKAVQGAVIRLHSGNSSWSAEARSGAAGEFTMLAIPAGSYALEVESAGFRILKEELSVSIGASQFLRLRLDLASASSAVTVSAPLDRTNPDTSSPPVTVSQDDIRRTAGADRSGSLSFITNFSPGSYMLHNHLHMRGGHQVAWLVDGVPVPNTNISSSVGRQIDPGDIQDVEISRGGFSAQYGDRGYGNINVIPRSGFEFDREAELTLSYGSFHQTNDQLRWGGHSRRLAVYGSAGGSRTDLGLEPPALDTIHNQGNALSGFTSVIFNAGPRDELRLSASLRRDRYQIPLAADDVSDNRDIDRERDGFANFSWVHTLGSSAVLSVSPFFHYNNARYEGGPDTAANVTTDLRTSRYSGLQSALRVVRAKYNVSGGIYGFLQRDTARFGLAVAQSGTDCFSVSGINPREASFPVL